MEAEEWVEGATLLVAVLCLGVTLWRSFTFWAMGERITRAIGLDGFGESWAYVVGLTFMFGRLFNWVEHWPFWVIAPLSLSMFVPSTVATLHLMRVVQDIRRGPRDDC